MVGGESTVAKLSLKVLTTLPPRHAKQQEIVGAHTQCQPQVLALPKAEPSVGAKREAHKGE
jgi:hypothetical protein